MKEIREVEYSFRFLNYANAAYQGRFAQLNILKQTNHPNFNEGLLQETADALKDLKRIRADFDTGQMLFIDIQGAPSRSGNEVLKMLTNLKPELIALANDVKRILATHDYYANLYDVALLISAYGRNAYNKDNYLSGQMAFMESLGNEEGRAAMEPQLKVNQHAIKDVNVFLMHYKNPMPEFPSFYEHVRFLCRTLPGRFRSMNHDLCQFETGMGEIFTFERAGFMRIEAQVWQQAGFQPMEAGYWRAYDINIEDAIRWKQNEIENPEIASEWMTAGFPIEVAVQWFSILLPPLLALQWANAGYSPQMASIFISEGFGVPDQIPEGKADEILSNGLKNWQREHEESAANEKERK